jgi:ribosome-associated translation inhibitor RaiA
MATSSSRKPAPVVLNMRLSGLALDEDGRDYITQRLQKRLSKFARSIERVTVRLRDVNGPRGGIDHACNIKVVLRRQSSVIVEHQADSAREAFNSAIAATEQAIRQSIGRTRTVRGR